jgi:arylsulfatase A-like enzyme
MVWLFVGCTAISDSAPVEKGVQSELYPDIFLITTDATNSAYLGSEAAQSTTPNLDQLFGESVVLPKVLTVRGVTVTSMPSFLSGFYPMTTRSRGDVNEGWSQSVPLIQERLHEMGYQTFGFSSNFCTYIEFGMDEHLCTADPGAAYYTEDQVTGDRMLVDGLLEALDRRDPNKPVFAWIHLILPHDQYDKLEPWYSILHPQPYNGRLKPHLQTSLDHRMLEKVPLDPADRAEMDAWYASGLGQTDAHIGRLLSGLKERGVYDDAIIVYGADHGEELALRNEQPYFSHGCSVYNEVMRVTWTIRASGLNPARLESWVSSTDITPTLVDLVGIPWKGQEAEGRSLKALLRQESTETVPVYAERTPSTAMVIHNGNKYLLNPTGGFPGCAPYQENGDTYEAPTTALWDLTVDPSEKQNLAGQGLEAEAELRRLVCTWISSPSWEGGVQATGMKEACNGG